MASQQQNPWHNRAKQPASRTPQNRSNTASPSPAAQQQQPNTPTQAAKPAQPPGNFWAQRANNNTSRESSNGRSDSAAPQRQQSPAFSPTSAFNAAGVKAFLARDALDAPVATYKVEEAGAKGGANIYSQTASNQPFFALLAKQIATLEGGG